MLKTLYTLYDLKQECMTGQPWLDNKDGAACRAFYEMCQNKDLIVGHHPEDFELWAIADIELETGTITKPDWRIVTSGQFFLDMQRPRDRTEQKPTL